MANRLHSEVAISVFTYAGSLSQVGSARNLGPTLFNIFISYLDAGLDSTLTLSADDTKLSGEMERSEIRALLHRDLNRQVEREARTV